MRNQSPDISFPLQLSIDLTGLCGLNCVYCYAQPFSKQTIAANKAIEILSLAKERGAFVIKIAGGEPLLHPQFIEILDFIIENNIHVAVLSSLAVSKRIALHTAKMLSGINHIDFQVSLDSIRPEINDITRGKTKQVLDNISLFLEQNIDLQIASVIAEQNIDYLIEIVDFFYPRVRRFHFMNVMPSIKVACNDGMLDLTPHASKKNQFWKTLLSKYGNKIITNPPTARQCTDEQVFSFQGCSAGHLLCVIDSTLDVIACNMAKTFVLGNLNDNTFDEIWNSPTASRIRATTTPLCHTYVSDTTKQSLADKKSLHLGGEFL